MRHDSLNECIWQKHQPAGYKFSTSCYERFQAIYVTSGKLCVNIGDDSREIGRDQAVLLRLGSKFKLSCGEKAYFGISYHATGYLPDDFTGEAEVISAKAESKFLIEMIKRELQTACPVGQNVLLGLGRAMAWQLIRQGVSNKSSSNSPEKIAQAARNILDTTLTSVISAREALKVLPLSYRQISRYFTDHFGCSPKQYQLQSRIDLARRLIEQTSLPVTSIAMELGYCSSQHFATQFRQITGESPTEYAKRLKQPNHNEN